MMKEVVLALVLVEMIDLLPLLEDLSMLRIEEYPNVHYGVY